MQCEPRGRGSALLVSPEGDAAWDADRAGSGSALCLTEGAGTGDDSVESPQSSGGTSRRHAESGHGGAHSPAPQAIGGGAETSPLILLLRSRPEQGTISACPKIERQMLPRKAMPCWQTHGIGDGLGSSGCVAGRVRHPPRHPRHMRCPPRPANYRRPPAFNGCAHQFPNSSPLSPPWPVTQSLILHTTSSSHPSTADLTRNTRSPLPITPWTPKSTIPRASLPQSSQAAPPEGPSIVASDQRTKLDSS